MWARKTAMAVMAISIVACGGEEDTSADVPAVPTKRRIKPTATASAEEAPSTPETPAAKWTYSPVGKRDPFRSYLAIAEQAGQAEEDKPKETQKFELDQYRLTGLVTGTAQPSAMVEDPTGKGHTLWIGTKLGRNGGIVTRITAAGIIVTEEFRAPTGERIRVPIEIKLPKAEIDLIIR